MLAWLKYKEVNHCNQTARFINLMLCIMMTITPLLTQIFFMIVTAQEPSLRQIIKGVATMGLINNIDTLFAGPLPPSIVANCQAMNASGMTMGQDSNSTWAATKRYYKSIVFTFGCKKTKADRVPDVSRTVQDANTLEHLIATGKASTNYIVNKKSSKDCGKI